MDLYKYKNDSENKKNILRIIYNEKGVSRSDLVERTGLSIATVIKFVTEFISDGTVDEYGTLESTGGRKSSMLRVNPDFAYIIGIDLGAHSTKISVVRINGDIVEKEIIPTSQCIPAKGINLDDICLKIDCILNKYSANRLLGIGIGVSGMVKPKEGEIIFCPNISGWDGVAITGILEKRYSVPVFLDTSSRCMVLAEQWFGVGKGVKNQVFVSIGFSVGAGIIIDSNIFRGSGGFSGELGHVQVDENGIKCTCGNYGCLEDYVTLPMIVGRIESNVKQFKGYSPMKMLMDTGGNASKDMILEALKRGDKIVYDDLMYTGKLIGIALTNMINVINPELIVLGGGVIENFPVVVESVERTIRERALITVQQNLSIKKSSLGWNGPVIGCSILLISKFLE